MAHVLVYADTIPTDVATALDATNATWKAVATVDAADRVTPDGGWSAAVVIGADFERAIEFCRAMRERQDTMPIILVVPSHRAVDVTMAEGAFDDFVLGPLRAGELETRLKLQAWKTGVDTPSDLVEYGGLVLNLATYQAAVAGRPLDMTYMEYELLKHFATHPGRVLAREELLRQVWGYEYYGGARTVDVHVRRLRAKLGEEYAQLIQTVRSVGYIFGRPRWGGDASGVDG